MGGWIATQTTSAGKAVSGLADYAHVYTQLFWWGLSVALVFLIAAPWIRKLMHGVH